MVRGHDNIRQASARQSGQAHSHPKPAIAKQPSFSNHIILVSLDSSSNDLLNSALSFEAETSDFAAIQLGNVFEWVQYKKNLESLYFVSGVGLFLVALLALYAAINQSSHARQARLATTYIDVSKGWDALESHKQAVTSFLDSEEYLQCGEMLRKICAGSLSPIPKQTTASSIKDSVETILSYLEEVGHLCRKRYLSATDMLDIIGDGVGCVPHDPDALHGTRAAVRQQRHLQDLLFELPLAVQESPPV